MTNNSSATGHIFSHSNAWMQRVPVWSKKSARGRTMAHGRVWRGIKRMQFSGERWTRQIWQVRYSSYEIAHHSSFCRWQQDATLVDKQLIAKQPRLANSGNWHEILQADHESCSSLSTVITTKSLLFKEAVAHRLHTMHEGMHEHSFLLHEVSLCICAWVPKVVF